MDIVSYLFLYSFEGELKPDMPSMDTDNCMDEQIIVNNGKGKLVEMTRRDAAELFKVQSTTTQKSTSKSKVLTQPKSAIREGKIRRGSQEQQSSTQNNIVFPPNTANDSSVFPLMEIRETCDETGNIINSEVVNMSNTMKRLEDNIDAGNTNDNEKDGKQFGELLAKTLKEGEEDITTYDDEGFVHVEAATPTTTASKPAIPKERISDKEYKSIYSRLEELERLEEEDMKSKAENAKSSKRLQSSGWSKGFLNKTKKSRGKSPATQKREDSSELKVSFTGSSEIKDLASQIESEKVVGFSSVSFDTEHKEIKAEPVESEKLVSFSSARSIDSSVSFCANEDSEIPVDVPSVGSSEKAVSFSAVSFDAEHQEIKDLPSPVESEKLVSFSSAKSIDSSVSFCANEDSEIDSLRKPYGFDSDKELRVSFSSVSFNAADIEIDSTRPPSSASSFVSGVTEYDLDIDDDEEEDGVDNPPQDYVPSVSFAENKNEVLEIPRIGQSKVPPRPAPGRPVSFTQDVRDEYIPVSTVPFEDNIFKGVVKERTDSEQKEATTAPKKKLSRFAQQRLERGL